MRMTIDLNAKVKAAGALGAGVIKHKQALAFAIPHMIVEDHPEEFAVKVVEYNVSVIEHLPTGRSYRVVSSKGFRFDVSPSFTKGAGRSKVGILSYKYYIDKVADGVAFCRVSEGKVDIIFKNTKNMVISDDGKVDLTIEFANN